MSFKSLARRLIAAVFGLVPAFVNAAPLFSPYKDATLSLNWNTAVISTQLRGDLEPLLNVLPRSVRSVTLGFATGECGAETWNGMTADALANANLPLLGTAKLNYWIATGGASGVFTCKSAEGMRQFIERYASPYLQGIDFDIESGQSRAVINELVKQVAAVQADYPKLRFRFTIATLGSSDGQASKRPYGDLNATGAAVVAALRQARLNTAIINLMVMDYGPSDPSVCVLEKGRCAMGRTAIQAAENLHARFNIPYQRIALTPMIGRNDIADEVFYLSDVDLMLNWAKSQRLASVHFWSFDRDRPCAQSFASPLCSSLSTVPTLAYTRRFIRNLSATSPLNAATISP